MGLNGSQGFKRLIPIFSKSIGAIITYLIIESMNFSNHITDGAKSNIERDFLVWKWFNDVISGLSTSFLESFRFAIYDVIQLEEIRQKYFNNDPAVSNDILRSYIVGYTLSDRAITNLKKAFCTAHPILYPHLQEMQSEYQN